MAKEGVMVELRCLGYSEKEIKHFQETTTCPRCGCDFSNLPSAADGLPTYPTARENKPDRSLSPKTKFNFQKKQKLSNCKDPIKSPVLTISAEKH